MEWKIGEIRQIKGEWYQCMEGNTCNGCAFSTINCDEIDDIFGKCTIGLRHDDKSVVFKKLEKVGEPFTGKVHVQLQRYNIYAKPIIDSAENVGYIDEGNTIAIEIKQTKEEMEEKKSNLKPFNLEQAKAGKPVCTRDGRKARIICFDKKCLDEQILIVLVDCGKEECMYFYTTDGKCIDDFSSFDLMMLPEKKVGYVNLYHNDNNERYAAYLGNNVIYKDKESAENIAEGCPNYIKTVKVEWEE